MIRITLISLAFLMLGISGDVVAKPSRVHVADRQEQKAIPLPAPAADNCRPSGWKSVSPNVIDQINGLIKQYNSVSDQLAKLPPSGTDTVMVIKPEKTGWISPRGAIYETPWNELRPMLQRSLSSKLSNLDCQLQALGVDMSKKI